ncbi:aminodeoxychorismate/anthranilate synthase component II [archaeon SCG-AAA382B04]|nr:aminodeoxychorismate/anthranilate synthase component II [archaeon SCG-AAA382B04]
MDKVLLIDCYDSFTYNLYQQLGELKIEPKVIKNDLELEKALDIDFDKIIISPGPGSPRTAGICKKMLEKTEAPTLGVCLGHQVIVEKYGGKVIEGEPTHGKKDKIFHNEKGLFEKLGQGIEVGRYHSLIAQKIPKQFEITAKTQDDKTMGIRHKNKPIFGIQFHTESILTSKGDKIIKNFLEL